jgi:hypothetical protein
VNADDATPNYSIAKPAWRIKPESKAAMEDLRHSDMLSLRNRIDDMVHAPSADWLYQAGIICTSLAAGSAFGGLSMLQEGPTPAVQKSLYWALTGAVFLLGVFALLAYRTADRQRGDSLEAILHRFDELLAAYEFVDAPSPPASRTQNDDAS